MGESKSFAVGHFAIGYLLSKATGKILKVDLNVPLVLVLAIIPDTDIALRELFPALVHRGPTHSIVVAFLVFVPLFAVYKKCVAPYLLAVVQHSLISDYVGGGGIQLFWPLTFQEYGIKLDIRSSTNVAIEWTAFLLAVLIMSRSKDLLKLLRPRSANLVLIIPTMTVLLPTFLQFPMFVPIWLIAPHLFYLLTFLASIIIALSNSLRRRQRCSNVASYKHALLQRGSFAEDER